MCSCLYCHYRPVICDRERTICQLSFIVNSIKELFSELSSTILLTAIRSRVNVRIVTDEIITIREAAALRNVTTSTIYQWMAQGRIKRHDIVTPLGKFCGVSRAEIVAYRPRSVGRPRIYPVTSGERECESCS